MTIDFNVTDMHETIYPYAIIERVDQGLFPLRKERHWFGRQEEKWGFFDIEAPEGYRCYYPSHDYPVAFL